MADCPLTRMVNQVVVLDTGTPIVYIGRLCEVTDHALVLEEADMHDCRDGHANPERYIAETLSGRVSVNRRRIVVMCSIVISASLLKDVVVD